MRLPALLTSDLHLTANPDDECSSSHKRITLIRDPVTGLATHERVKACFYYDPMSGALTWRIRQGKAIPGQRAGRVMPNGRRELRLDGQHYYTYRLAWFYMTGKWPVDQIDHRDTNPGNDSWRNLREADHSLNQQNQVKARTTNKSTGVLGVSWSEKDQRFVPKITVKGRMIRLGSFKELNDAALVYLTAKQIHHPGATL